MDDFVVMGVVGAASVMGSEFLYTDVPPKRSPHASVAKSKGGEFGSVGRRFFHQGPHQSFHQPHDLGSLAPDARMPVR